MKKHLLASAAILAIGAASSANAADLAVKAPVPVYAAPVFTWTGCYVGGHAGYGWSKPKLTDHNASSSLIDYEGFGRTAGIDSSGVLFGGQLGCDYQFSGNFVIGISGSVSGTSITGRDVNVYDIYGGAITAKTSWLADISGRIGYAFGQSLIYVKGGAAWNKTNYTNQYEGYLGQNFGGNNSGALVGVGFEYAFVPNLSLFAEYNHYFFDTKTFTTGGYYSGYLVDVKQDFDVVKMGINWRFNGMSAAHY